MLLARLEIKKPARDLSAAKVVELPCREGFAPIGTVEEYVPSETQFNNWAEAKARRLAHRP